MTESRERYWWRGEYWCWLDSAWIPEREVPQEAEQASGPVPEPAVEASGSGVSRSSKHYGGGRPLAVDEHGVPKAKFSKYKRQIRNEAFREKEAELRPIIDGLEFSNNDLEEQLALWRIAYDVQTPPGHQQNNTFYVSVLRLGSVFCAWDCCDAMLKTMLHLI